MAPKYKLIQSLSRAFAIIDCFNEDERELTLNQISERVSLNINTTRGLAQTLLHYDYLYYDEESNKYRLGLIFVEKAEIAQFNYTKEIIQLIRGDLQRIADKYAVSIRLISINNISTTTVLERSPSRSRYILMIHDQTDFPLHASATGKLILSRVSQAHLKQILSKLDWEKYGKNTIMDEETLLNHLEKITELGFAYESEELGDGYSSVAIPVLKDGDLVFSLSAVGTTEIIKKNTRNLLDEMQEIREKVYEVLK